MASLGTFLLLRVSPLMERSLVLSCAVVALGLATAVFAYLSGSVQTDIKSALSFASVTQVGLIVAEIGLGLHWIALIHLIGHACLRTLQFVRAPTLLVVGGNDPVVVKLNREALSRLRVEKDLVVVPGATHLFEEPGALDEVSRLAADWFVEHLRGR